MDTPPIRVLLVEDNPGDALLIHEMLCEEQGTSFHLTRVERLAAARDAIEQLKFDVVLLDLSLPDSQGLDTFRSLRKTGPRLPVVVLTGLDDEGQGIQAIREGAQDYLLKGRITEVELAHSLHFALQRHERQQQMEASLRSKESELRVARKIHHDLLPHHSPSLSEYDTFGASLSASDLGGNLFQYLRLSDGAHALAIGDVTGHGIGPALLMAAVRSYLPRLCPNAVGRRPDPDPDEPAVRAGRDRRQQLHSLPYQTRPVQTVSGVCQCGPSARLRLRFRWACQVTPEQHRRTAGHSGQHRVPGEPTDCTGSRRFSAAGHRRRSRCRVR